jgi:predicted DNA-binding transcriptional regulator YafY
MTARKLAEELEVSERTIYRDINALSAAGVPIYADPGMGGGYALLDSFRTNLTGLTEGEVRALFMLSIPAPLADLGVSQELKAALLKLSAALPDARRRDEERVRQRFHLDSIWWNQGEDPVPHLQTVHQAVWQDRKLHLTYRIHVLAIEIEQLVDPYGLVAKAGVWYLVYARSGCVRTLRVSELLDARISEQPFERPGDFDLVAFWKAWCVKREESRSYYPVIVRVAPSFLSELLRYFGDHVRTRIAQAGPPDADGWIALELPFESLEAARERILGFGKGVEVLEPLALRMSVLDYAVQIVALYTR